MITTVPVGFTVPIILFLLIMVAGWILGIVLFEMFYQWLRKNGVMDFGKKNCCAAWWIVLFLCSTASGGAAFLLNLLIMLPILLGHVHMAGTKAESEVITVAEVLKAIPDALRLAAQRIRPFLKK